MTETMTSLFPSLIRAMIHSAEKAASQEAATHAPSEEAQQIESLRNLLQERMPEAVPKGKKRDFTDSAKKTFITLESLLKEHGGRGRIIALRREYNINSGTVYAWKQEFPNKTRQLLKECLEGHEHARTPREEEREERSEQGKLSLKNMRAELAGLRAEVLAGNGESGEESPEALSDEILPIAQVIARRKAALEGFFGDKDKSDIVSRVGRRLGRSVDSVRSLFNGCLRGTGNLPLTPIRAIVEEYGIDEATLRGQCYTQGEWQQVQREREESNQTERQPKKQKSGRQVRPPVQDAHGREAEEGIEQAAVEKIGKIRLTVKKAAELLIKKMGMDEMVETSHVYITIFGEGAERAAVEKIGPIQLTARRALTLLLEEMDMNAMIETDLYLRGRDVYITIFNKEVPLS